MLLKQLILICVNLAIIFSISMWEAHRHFVLKTNINTQYSQLLQLSNMEKGVNHQNVTFTSAVIFEQAREVIHQDGQGQDNSGLLNMIGSLRDSFISGIIPLDKDELEKSENVDLIKNSAIDPQIEIKNSDADDVSMAIVELVKTTLDTVHSATKSLSHISDVFHSAKRFIHNTETAVTPQIVNVNQN